MSKQEKTKTVQQLKREIKAVKNEIRSHENKLREVEKEFLIQKDETDKLAQDARDTRDAAMEANEKIKLKLKQFDIETRKLKQDFITEKQNLSTSLYDIKYERMRINKLTNLTAQKLSILENKIQAEIELLLKTEKREKQELELSLLELQSLESEEHRLIQLICGVKPPDFTKQKLMQIIQENMSLRPAVPPHKLDSQIRTLKALMTKLRMDIAKLQLEC
ncbi:hypothetical protein GPJ56_006000 [Histomonas meleagridis]|uniref:uncharacterized protein n=1 Tax=Histomonas meleagridis TaxID=135588 RepID=UPI003559FFE8|nr:hypothetical protein GPJ56_006000 [Histomonas meleagridis]KAH0799407.1 hypothetical protein GO595_007808 [Histomonas meleagridis]